MTEIYINGQLVDTQDAEIVITAQALTFDKLGSRRGSYSNVFELAKTNSNRALFDNCDLVTSLTRVPYTRNTCQIFEDGILIVNGSAVILATKDNYRLYVTAGNTDFFKAIGSIKLNEVDLSEYDHLYDGDGVTQLVEIHPRGSGSGDSGSLSKHAARYTPSMTWSGESSPFRPARDDSQRVLQRWSSR